MISDEIKEYLGKYRESARKSIEISEHLAELRIIAENLKDEEGQNVSLEKAMADLIDARNETAEELERLFELRKEILALINSVPNSTQRTVLYQHYVLGKTWEQVAVNLDYHYVSVCRIHGQALLEIDKLLNSKPS